MGGTKKLSGEGNVELGTIEFPSLNLRINWESLPKLQRFGPPPVPKSGNTPSLYYIL